MTNWSVTIEAAEPESGVEVHPDALEKLLEILEPRGAVVMGGGRRYGARFDVEGFRHAHLAIAEAWKVFDAASREAGTPRWRVVAAEAQTWEDQERELEQPVIPPLVGVSEAAGILGVTRQRVSQLMKASNPAFPRPIYELAATPVWTISQIERFAERWVRKSGRPARTVIEVVRLADGRWEVRHRDGAVVEGVDPFNKKDEAVKWAHVIANLAKPSQLLIFDDTGRVTDDLRFTKESA